MVTYAEMWNTTWTGPTSSGPTHIVVDGLYEELEEEEHLMDVEEPSSYYLQDLDSLVVGIRNGRQAHTDGQSSLDYAMPVGMAQWKDEMTMDVDQRPSLNVAAWLAVVDTNVFLSHLPLLKSLVTEISKHPELDVSLVVPGVVLHELDGLKNSRKTERMVKPDKTEGAVLLQDLARHANSWLYDQVTLKQNQIIRIQKDFETPRAPSWRLNRGDLTNDMIILECALYFLHQYNLAEGSVKLLSSDKNLSLLSQQHGIPPIAPRNHWSAFDLLGKVFPALASPPIQGSRQPAVIVDHSVYSPPLPGHENPLTALHNQILDYVEVRLPNMMVDAIEQEKTERSLEDPNLSIYARRSFPIPDEQTWRSSTRECIRFIYDTMAPGVKSTSSAKTTLGDFLTRPDRPGGRKGQHWGRGDWNTAASELLHFFGPHDIGQLPGLIDQAFDEAAGTRR